jgi:heptaprenyl diphosphate synthase
VEAANKPVQSDYEQGVITLPLIHALHNLSDFKNKAEEQRVSREEINAAVAEAGGTAFTRLIVKRYYNKARKLIDGLTLTESKREKLIAILGKASRIN